MDTSKQQKTPKGKTANQKQDRNKTPQQEIEVLSQIFNMEIMKAKNNNNEFQLLKILKGT